VTAPSLGLVAVLTMGVEQWAQFICWTSAFFSVLVRVGSGRIVSLGCNDPGRLVMPVLPSPSWMPW
jgi:hypothetical protein